MNHEFYNTWLTLTDPEDGGNDSEPKGYLLVSCYIIGAKDQPPVHTANEGVKDPDADEFGDTPDEDLTPEQLLQRRERMKNYSVLGTPTLVRKSYQLNINIARAEELPKVGMNGTNPFISARVGNMILKTSMIEGSQKPKFSTRLRYPVQFPLLNDKIVMKCWHRRTMMSDIFIANIPENPFVDGWFNVNYLQSTGGNLPFTWINFYGIPVEERSSWYERLFNSGSKFVEGTEFMGRVLLSMNLIPHDKPEKGAQYLSGSNEPETLPYQLRADIVEAHLNNAEETIKVVVMFGSKSPVEMPAPVVDKKSQDSTLKKFKWKGKKVQAEPISEQYPVDTQQVPDIFINIYTTSTFKGERRIGYVRVPANEASLSHNFANWYQIKDPTNNFDGKSPGILLANLRLLQGEATKTPRSMNRYDNEAQLNVYCYIYSCVELSPESPSDRVRARIELSFCDLNPNGQAFEDQRKEIERAREEAQEAQEEGQEGEEAEQDDEEKSALSTGKKSRKGRDEKKEEKKDKRKSAHPMIIESDHLTKNPIFGKNRKGEVIIASAKVPGGIDMAPNMIVSIYNAEEKNILGGGGYKPIGNCYISPKQCRVVKGLVGELAGAEPQYHTIMGPGGTIEGKILMLVAFSKNMKESIAPGEFVNQFDLKTNKYKLDFSCIGIRNLDSSCPNPQVTLRIPSYRLMLRFKQGTASSDEPPKKGKEAEKPVYHDRGFEVEYGGEVMYEYEKPDENQYVSSLIDYNPNICSCASIAELDLPENPLFWPRVEIEVLQINTVMMNSQYFTTLDLIECADHLPKYNSDVLKEKLGIIRRSGDGGGEEGAGGDDKALAGMNNMVEGLYLDSKRT